MFIFLRRTSLELPPKSIPLFVIIAIIAVVYNYFSVSAIGSAPNPGYVEAITSFRVVIILMLSVLIFGSNITPIRVMGIALCTGGLILISL
jgi:uncharacterized membrane protein